MKRSTTLIATSMVLGTAALVLFGQSQDGAQAAIPACFGWPQDPATTVAACAELIESQRLSDAHQGEALFYTGLAHDLADDHAEAIEAYTAAQAYIPERRALYYNRARLHYLGKRYDLAVTDSERAVELASNWRSNAPLVQSLYLLERSQMGVGDKMAAVETLGQVLAVAPDEINALERRVRHTSDDRLDWPQPVTKLGRLSDVARLIDLKGLTPELLMARSDTLSGLGLKLNALEDHALALQSAPGAVPNTGWAHSSLVTRRQHLAEATAQPCGAEDLPCLEERSAAFWEAGNLPRAIEDVDAILAIDPDQPRYVELRQTLVETQATLERLGVEPPAL